MKKIMGLLLLGSIAFGCGSTRTVVSMQGLDCQSCGRGVAKALREQGGVEDAQFIHSKAEIVVHHDVASVGIEKLLQAIEEQGYKALEGAGKGTYNPFPEYPEGHDVAWLSKKGEVYASGSEFVAGKTTVVDFYAPWCGPCREVDRFLIERLREGGTFAVRKVNVVDWDTPVARQMSGTLESLPYVKVYGPEGKLRDSFSGLNLKRLQKAIESTEGGAQ